MSPRIVRTDGVCEFVDDTSVWAAGGCLSFLALFVLFPVAAGLLLGDLPWSAAAYITACAAGLVVLLSVAISRPRRAYRFMRGEERLEVAHRGILGRGRLRSVPFSAIIELRLALEEHGFQTAPQGRLTIVTRENHEDLELEWSGGTPAIVSAAREAASWIGVPCQNVGLPADADVREPSEPQLVLFEDAAGMPAVKRPEHLSLVQDARHHFTVSHAARKTGCLPLFLLAFILGWMPNVVLPTLEVFATGWTWGGAAQFWIGLLGVGLAGRALSRVWLRRTTIDVHEGNLTMETALLGKRAKWSIPVREVVQIRQVQDGGRGQDSFASWAVIVDSKRDSIVLVERESERASSWLARELAGRLCVPVQASPRALELIRRYPDSRPV